MPIVNNRSFVYQETPNDYSDIKQTIKGQQMLTLKKFQGQSPTSGESPDYYGQIGAGSKPDGSPTVWISNAGPNSVNGWDQISTGPYSDEFANKDKANNFSNLSQTILNKQIPYVDQGYISVDHVPIKGQGHIYIDASVVDQPRVHIAMVATGGGYQWVQITDHTELDNIAMKNTQNNFKDGRQTIINQSIASINPSLSKPLAPVRSGEMFLKKGDSTKGEKPALWISTSTATGAFEWVPVSASLDQDIVYRNVKNNFTEFNQTIVGKQIMSFASRGDQPPSGYKPDYDGQMYIAFKTLSTGTKDAAVWVANGNTWVPLSANLDPSKVAMKDKENEFTNASQTIKTGTESSQITGARIKLGDQSPIADSSYKATMLGEVCVYKNDSVVPSEISVWLAISINPSPTTNAGEWTMIYSSKMDYTKMARTDLGNTFEKGQRIIGATNKPQDVVTARFEYDDTPKNKYRALNVGELFITDQEQPGGAPDEIDVWMAHKPNDPSSWVKIYDKPIDKIVRSNEETFFTDKLFLGAPSNTKRLRINGAREAKGTVYNTTMPLQLGETVMCEVVEGSKTYIVIYMCAMDQSSTPEGQKSRKNWIEIGRRLKSELVH
ncbi:MAG: hypothetical protein ACRCWQ_10795 [Bacilli bacterium]